MNLTLLFGGGSFAPLKLAGLIGSFLNYNPMKKDKHYKAVENFYRGRYAIRSGFLYLRHINEGLEILDYNYCGLETLQAWCLHPLVQDDKDLDASCLDQSILLKCKPSAVALMLAMEYRAIANSYLSKHYRSPHDRIVLSSIPEVNEMLVADKLQNYKDMMLNTNIEPARKELLTNYFYNWFNALKIHNSYNYTLKAIFGEWQ